MLLGFWFTTCCVEAPSSCGRFEVVHKGLLAWDQDVLLEIANICFGDMGGAGGALGLSPKLAGGTLWNSGI